MGTRILSGFRIKKDFLSRYCPDDKVEYCKRPVDLIQLAIYNQFQNCRGVVIHGSDNKGQYVPVSFYGDPSFTVWYVKFTYLAIVSN